MSATIYILIMALMFSAYYKCLLQSFLFYDNLKTKDLYPLVMSIPSVMSFSIVGGWQFSFWWLIACVCMFNAICIFIGFIFAFIQEKGWKK